jgi:hypothetical protein
MPDVHSLQEIRTIFRGMRQITQADPVWMMMMMTV